MIDIQATNMPKGSGLHSLFLKTVKVTKQATVTCLKILKASHLAAAFMGFLHCMVWRASSYGPVCV